MVKAELCIGHYEEETKGFTNVSLMEEGTDLVCFYSLLHPGQHAFSPEGPKPLSMLFVGLWKLLGERESGERSTSAGGIFAAYSPSTRRWLTTGNENGELINY